MTAFLEKRAREIQRGVRVTLNKRGVILSGVKNLVILNSTQID